MKSLLAALTLGALLGACTPATPGRIQPSLDAAPDVIDGAVSRSEAVRLLTETTLRCTQADHVVGLNQWVCEVDNSAGSDKARYFVMLLADAEDRLRFIDAQVFAVGDAGLVQRFASFFRDTVLSRLVPDLAGQDEAETWIEDRIGGSSSDDVGPVHMRLDRIDRTVRLQLSKATGI